MKSAEKLMGAGASAATIDAARVDSPVAADPLGPVSTERRTRDAVVKLLLEEGPITAPDIGERLSLTAAGVRRHLDALLESGEAHAVNAPAWAHRGRGRPPKMFQLTATGRGKLVHAYDDLAGAAMRQLREIGGEEAIKQFARRRVEAIVAGVEPLHEPGQMEAKAKEIAGAFTSKGFAASIREVGSGVQICQHHCPVSHVAEEFPELCEAELEAFREILGTHVQRLATIANGNCACTTNIPLTIKSAGRTTTDTEEGLA